VYQQQKVMNSFFKYKNIHKFTLCAHVTESIADNVQADPATAKLAKGNIKFSSKIEK
jgi:hypothetical protein